MTDTRNLRWLTADLERMRKPALISLLADMDDVPPSAEGWSMARIIGWIKERRSAYWEAKHSGKPMAAPPSGFTGLTATEINEDLRTRPPVPLWGE